MSTSFPHPEQAMPEGSATHDHSSEPFFNDDPYQEASAENVMPRHAPNWSDHHRRGRTYVVPAEKTLLGYLHFSDDEMVGFNNVRHHRFQICKYILDSTLDDLNLCE